MAKSSRPGGSNVVVKSPRGQSLYKSFLGLISVFAPQAQPAGTGRSRKTSPKKAVAKKKVAMKKRAIVLKRVAAKKSVAHKK